ncbi:MAG: hypothetical protein KDC95_10500 [Planctomycetes bacterium]|nr:hypothetical protein [Planctomycetota bacterium]
MTVNQHKNRRVGDRLLRTLALGIVSGLAACGGGAPGNRTGESSADGARASLLGIEYGRLVDIYSWKRVNADDADRLAPSNREPVLVEREALINPLVRDENPFTNGQARYRFMPYNPDVGHRELLILWDDEFEADEFASAVASAKAGIPVVSPYFAFATGLPTTPPIVPRDATLRLTFDRPLGLDQEFFDATPGLVQVLQLSANPDVVDTSVAYTPIPSRVISKENGKRLLVDVEVSGKEAINRVANPDGLPAALDRASANIRIALPVAGPAAQRFRVRVDAIPNFNSKGLNGVAAVIRDFRSGNSDDANRGALPDNEAPRLVARKEMGIRAVDITSRVLTVHKRFADVVLRPRIPFVDGPYSSIDGRPLGPNRIPQARPLISGDVIWQTVESPATGERVTIAAQIIENLDIPANENDSGLGIGKAATEARLVVDTVHGYDSAGNVVTFEASTDTFGKECTAVVAYHHSITLGTGTVEVGDSARIAEFLTFVPAPPRFDSQNNPLPPNENIDPVATVALNFSKPMSIETVRPENNFVIANKLGAQPEFIANAKVGGLAVVPTEATDLYSDGTSIRLNTPLGLFHENSAEETYYVHLLDGLAGPTDRAGEPIDIWEPQGGIAGITTNFKLSKTAASNYVGSFLARMDSLDENGTSEASSSADYFGQYQQRDGRLYGLLGQRFGRVVDQATMPNVRNDLSRRCHLDTAGPNDPPEALCPGVSAQLYQTPLMLFNGLGGIAEPFVSQGSRMQQTYREVDFNLGYTEPAELEIDVERLSWAPFVARSPSKLTYDLFDRMSITLSHSEKRPDLRMVITQNGPNQCCGYDQAGFLSGLVPTFEANYLDNAPRTAVVEDSSYTINPNDAFAAVTGSTMIAYPAFKESFTWRDRRIMAIDSNGNILGLGGAQAPNDPQRPDRTRDVTSPHLPEEKPDLDGADARQPDDYKGDRVQDLGPFALPMLVDFFVYPDDPANGLVKADNLFQIGYIGPLYPAAGHGYYNAGWPNLRVHSTGGIDSQQNEIFVDPPNELTAQGGWLNNAILGRFQAPPGDDHLYWGQADFVRKVSVVTGGYFDTLIPGKNQVQGPVGWPADPNGYPNLSTLGTNWRPSEFAVLLNPAPESLPKGTQVVVEYRMSEGFSKSDAVYASATTETAASRNNLLNPHFACEQYRYMASSRVQSNDVTNYVQDIDSLVDPVTGVARRFMNYRITFVNNPNVEPARVPYIDYFAVVWRVKEPK